MPPDTENKICYVPNHLINKEKWDACIALSDAPLIYAKSVYLDGMCLHWDALIMDDYKAVMPLPWNRKWLVKYVYSPYFVIAGGVFGKRVSEEIFGEFIKAISVHAFYVELDLNERNLFPDVLNKNHILHKSRRNTFLTLHRSYQDISSGYSTLAKRKLRKAYSHHFSVDTSATVEKVIQLYKQYYRHQDSVVSKFDFSGMIALLEGKLKTQTRTYILSLPNGEICAFYLLLFDDNYVYWLLGGSTEIGKEAAAFYYLTDLVIHDFANTNRTFRFEGSDHEGIHFFNRQFGGQTVLYPKIKINRLPVPFRYLKGTGL